MIPRLAKNSDLDELYEMAALMHEELSGKFGLPSRTDFVQQNLKWAVENEEAVMVTDGNNVGLAGFCAWAHLPGMEEGLCLGFGAYVRLGYRGLGIAPKLRCAAEQHCIGKGYTAAIGEVGASNLEAIKSLSVIPGGRIIGYTVRKDFGDPQQESELSWLLS